VIKNINSTAILNNGVAIPYLGLGVYLMNSGNETVQTLKCAFDIGYRHIDTAMFYDNELEVGQAVKQSTIPREEIFVTTKLWNSDHGYNRAIKAFHQSLKKLNLDYIDLYLIHWPVTKIRADSWRALETLYRDGKCRAIGVSNYTIQHLKELLNECEIIPSINQVEFSPFLYQEELLNFCRKHEIQLEAYSPLTRGEKFNNSFLLEVCWRYNKSPAQILIRWALEHEIVVIPKSSNQDRIKENANVFDFSIIPSDMEILNQLDENFRVSWDPSMVI
jgi:diketogulonate reductase-like aldo/keto reductase